MVVNVLFVVSYIDNQPSGDMKKSRTLKFCFSLFRCRFESEIHSARYLDSLGVDPACFRRTQEGHHTADIVR